MKKFLLALIFGITVGTSGFAIDLWETCYSTWAVQCFPLDTITSLAENAFCAKFGVDYAYTDYFIINPLTKFYCSSDVNVKTIKIDVGAGVKFNFMGNGLRGIYLELIPTLGYNCNIVKDAPKEEFNTYSVEVMAGIQDVSEFGFSWNLGVSYDFADSLFCFNIGLGFGDY